jgi:hypothetical protein
METGSLPVQVKIIVKYIPLHYWTPIDIKEHLRKSELKTRKT